MQVMNNPLLLVTIHDVIYLKDFLPCVNWHENIECSHSEIRFEEILPTTIKREICKSKRKKHMGNREVRPHALNLCTGNGMKRKKDVLNPTRCTG